MLAKFIMFDIGGTYRNKNKLGFACGKGCIVL